MMKMIRGSRLEDAVELDGKKPLGKGTFGTVYRGRMKGGSREAVAVKIMLKEKMKAMRVPDSMVNREAEMMQECNGRKEFVQFYELIDTSSQFCMVLELCVGGDLQEAAQQGDGILGEEQVRRLMRQMLQGLAFLHQRHICHRDVKPHNYLLDGSVRSERVSVKLADFGIAIRMKPGKLLKEQAGTPAFMAPEMHLLPKKSKGYDVAVDLWALGVVMVFLLASEYPFMDGSGRLLRNKIIRGEQPLWEGDVFSSLFQRFQEAAGIAKKRPSRLSRELSRKLLTPRRQDRITVEAAFGHEWFMRPITDGDDGADDAPLLNWGEITSGLSSIEKEFQWVGDAIDVFTDVDVHSMPSRAELSRRNECNSCCKEASSTDYLCPVCGASVCSGCVRSKLHFAPVCPCCGDVEHTRLKIREYLATVDALEQAMDTGIQFARRLSMGFSDTLGITSERGSPAIERHIGKHPEREHDRDVRRHVSRERTDPCRGGVRPVAMPFDFETEAPLDRGMVRREHTAPPSPQRHGNERLPRPQNVSPKWCCLCDEATGMLDHVCLHCSASICSMCVRGRFLHDPSCPHCGLQYDDATVQSALSANNASAAARSLWTGVFGCNSGGKRLAAPPKNGSAATLREHHQRSQHHERTLVSL